MKPNFADFVTELFQTIGPITSRKMFGDYGVFLDGLMFGIIDGNTLYLKTDSQNESLFIDKGLEKFSYQKKEQRCYLNYHQAPEEALEDLEKTRYWGNIAYETALRAAAKKSKKAK